MAIRLDEIPETTGPVRLDSIPDIQPIRLDQVEFQSAKGPIGFTEAFISNPTKFVPVFGSMVEAQNMASIVAAAKRLENEDYAKAPSFILGGVGKESMDKLGPIGLSLGIGEPKWSPELQKQTDLEAVTNWWNQVQEQQQRGTTLGGKAGLIISEMPSFMIEFALTGGAAKAGEKIAKEGLEKFLKNRLSSKVAKALLGKFASAGVRTPLLMTRVAKAYQDRRLPKNIQLKDGDIIFEWPKDKPFTSFLKAYGDIFTEAFSEELGEFVKLPFGKKLSEKLFSKMKIKNPKLTYTDFIKRLSTRAGFNGIVGEIGEEFVGDALRAVVNIQDFGAGEKADVFQRLSSAMKQDFQNLPAMAIGFAAPAGVRGAASLAAFGLENTGDYKFSPEEIISRAESQKTIDAKMEEDQTAYLKRKPRTIPKVERGPEIQVIELEDGLTPDPTYRVPAEAQAEEHIDRTLPPTEKVQELIDSGVSPDKAAVWAQRLSEPEPEAPLDPELVKSAEQISKDLGVPIQDALEIAKNARAGGTETVPNINQAIGRAEQIIQQHEPEPPAEAPVAKPQREKFTSTPKRIEVIQRAKETARQQSILEAAKQLADENGMDINVAVDLVQRLRGENKRTAPLGSVIKTQLGKRNAAILRIAAGSKEAFDGLMSYIEATGGLRENPELLGLQLENMRALAKRGKKIRQRQDKAGLEDKSINLLHPFQAIRYALANFEIASRFPLRVMYRRMNIRHNQTRRQIEEEVRTALSEAGMSPETLTITNEENDLIKSWLFSGNEVAYNKLSKRIQGLSQQLRKLLQGRGARDVKSYRWKLWKKYGIVPAGIPQGSKADNILEEGLLAEQEGVFDQWLDRQKWGARETYYMSEGFEDTTEGLLSLLEPGTFYENAVARKPGITPAEAHTRTAAKTYKKGMVLNNVHTHLTRLALANSLFDDLDVFWAGFNQANPSKKDVSNMKAFITHLLGKNLEVTPAVDVARKARGVFWNLYFIDPFKSAWFFFRNSLQNMAYLPSQMSLNELRKTSSSLVKQKTSGKYSAERVEDFGAEWEDDINQKKKIYQEAILTREEITAFERHNKKLADRARRLADKTASWALTSDSMNRTLAWHTFYDAAYRNFNEFADGKSKLGKVRRRLKLDVLDVTQVNEILQALDSGNVREATKLYATYKTENVHFRYETTLRSAAEQSPGSRLLLGLAVYPRGVFNLAYKNGALPLIQGLKTGDFNKAYQGLGSILSLIIFTALARQLLKAVTGKDSYGIPTYTPIDPGISTIQRLMDGAFNSAKKGPAATIKTMATNLEFAIPLADEISNMYEAQKDVKGVKFWQLVLSGLKSEYKYKYKKQWKKTNRSDWEKISHVLFSGGFETEEK